MPVRRPILALGIAALCVAAFAAPTAAKPHHFKPRGGTYAGVGQVTAAGQRYEMRIVFHIHDGLVDDVTNLNNFPGCSTGSGSNSGVLTGKRFELLNDGGAYPSSRTIAGKFTDSHTIAGTEKVVYPTGVSTCGTPGTYNYRWVAKRVGKP